MDKNIILGINTGHDGSVAIMAEGKIVAHMAEERVTRVKRAYGWLNSLKYCLSNTNIELRQVGSISYSDYNNTNRFYNESYKRRCSRDGISARTSS